MTSVDIGHDEVARENASGKKAIYQELSFLNHQNIGEWQFSNDGLLVKVQKDLIKKSVRAVRSWYIRRLLSNNVKL